jgi:2-polyprenyl-3-methyl-5-hydroxy-6-metoxy-1,4-benzoquinol methylase
MSMNVQLDQTKAAAFEERLVDVLNAGALSLMVSIGHRTGLFDAMAPLPPATSLEIASQAALQERYVREWLGRWSRPGSSTMTCRRRHTSCRRSMRVISRARQRRATLPSSPNTSRCSAASRTTWSAASRPAGGVPYSRYGRFHEVMAEDSGQTVLPVLREHILPLVPGLSERLEAGIRVLDVGCGRGRALNLMAGWFPNSRFVGFDLADEAIAFARQEAERQGHANIAFLSRDLSRFDKEADHAAFDLVTTFDAVHDQANPRAVLRGIRVSLAPDGVYLAQDIKGSSHVHRNREHPVGTLLYTISCMHCMTVSLAQNGEGLGAMSGRERAEELMREAGFRSIEVHELPHDFQNYYYVCRP